MLYPLSYAAIRSTRAFYQRQVRHARQEKFGDQDQPHRYHCPKCGVKLTQGEKDSERCRNGHALTT